MKAVTERGDVRRTHVTVRGEKGVQLGAGVRIGVFIPPGAGLFEQFV
jgi:hypothetical protein